jgi:hypothetical protein
LSDRKSSLIRRAKARAIQRKLRAMEIRQIRAVLRKMKRAETADRPLTLWPHDLAMIRRAAQQGLSGRPQRVGAPVLLLLARFHRLLAIEVLWHRRDGTKAKKAYSMVVEKWQRQVDQRTMEKAVSEHRVAAAKFLAQCATGTNDPEKIREQTEIVIEQQADVFRILFGLRS